MSCNFSLSSSLRQWHQHRPSPCLTREGFFGCLDTPLFTRRRPWWRTKASVVLQRKQWRLWARTLFYQKARKFKRVTTPIHCLDLEKAPMLVIMSFSLLHRKKPGSAAAYLSPVMLTDLSWWISRHWSYPAFTCKRPSCTKRFMQSRGNMASFSREAAQIRAMKMCLRSSVNWPDGVERWSHGPTRESKEQPCRYGSLMKLERSEPLSLPHSRKWPGEQLTCE